MNNDVRSTSNQMEGMKDAIATSHSDRLHPPLLQLPSCSCPVVVALAQLQLPIVSLLMI